MAAAIENAWAVAYLAYPTIVFFYFVVCLIFFRLGFHRRYALANQASVQRRMPAIVLLSIFVVVSVVQAITTAILFPTTRTSIAAEHIVVAQLSCALVFGVQLSHLLANKTPEWHALQGSWFLGIVCEILVLCLGLSSRPYPRQMRAVDISNTVVAVSKCILLVVLVGSLLLRTDAPHSSAERQPLLIDSPTEVDGSNGRAVTDLDTYGSITRDGTRESDSMGQNTHDQRTSYTNTNEPMSQHGLGTADTCWSAKDLLVLLPHIWPAGLRHIQLRAVGVVFCILCTVSLNVLIPRQVGVIIDTLMTPNTATTWLAIATLAFLHLVVSSSGIGLLREWLWMPIRAHLKESMARAVYSHMLHLSADFHDSQSTSYLLLVSSGGEALQSMIEIVFLQMIPLLMDTLVAVVYLSVSLGPFEGLITTTTGTIFCLLAGHFLSSFTPASRLRKESLDSEHSLRYNGLAAWHDASALNQLEYEDNRHSDAVTARQVDERRYSMNWLLSVAIESAILILGLWTAAFLAVYRVRTGQATSGQFVMLLAYWRQLIVPLSSLTSIGDRLSDQLINVEKLIKVMKMKPSVGNQKNARPLRYIKGEVEFDQTCFGYDNQKVILSGVSLQIPAGYKVAFLGSQGAGKSTLLKLLCRHYDVTSGSIQIDGQDVRGVDIRSLRDRVGIVPQFPVLFDDTIMNNVRYGRITASDDEVYSACKAVCIHQKICSFEKGYDTKVGERRMRLSGGEIQLLAIARVIIKNPDILVLDEATSTLDTETEQQVLASMASRCHNRTTLIITKRLSTTMKCDLIVVLDGGRILEQGSHMQLLDIGGKYAKLWENQVTRGTLKIVVNGSPKSTKSRRGHGQKQAPPSQASPSAVVTVAHKTVSPKHNHLTTKERSKLNPVAPTFTPRGTRVMVSAVRATSSTEDTNTESLLRMTSSQTSRQWSDEVTAEEEKQKLAVHLPSYETTSTPSRKQVRGQMEGSPAQQAGVSANADPRIESTVQQASCSGPRATQTSKAKEVDDIVPNLAKVHFKHPRYSRRVQSKSEPCHELPEPQEAENKSSLELLEADSPSQRAQTSQQHRRVSAPALKPTQYKSKIARILRRSKQDVESQDVQTQPMAKSSEPVPDSKASKMKSENNTPGKPASKTATDDQMKDKKLETTLQFKKQPPIPSSSAAPSPSGEDRRGSRRGRGGRHHGRRRGSRKPLSALPVQN